MWIPTLSFAWAYRCRTRHAGMEAGFGFASRAREHSEPWTRTPASTRRSPPCRGSLGGLDFHGNLAFIGLSQVRESAAFSGIPITERLAPEQRACGVYVVDLTRGETIALLKFPSAVQEIFAVALLPRRFPDLINDDEKLLEGSFVVPAACLGEVASTVRVG